MKKLLLLVFLGFVSLQAGDEFGGSGSSSDSAEDNFEFGYSDENYVDPNNIPGYSETLSSLDPFDVRQRMGLLSLGFLNAPKEMSDAVQQVQQILQDTGLIDVNSLFYDDAGNLKTSDVAVLTVWHNSVFDLLEHVSGEDMADWSAESVEDYNQQPDVDKFYLSTIQAVIKQFRALESKMESDLDALKATAGSSGWSGAIRNAASTAWSYVPSLPRWAGGSSDSDSE